MHDFLFPLLQDLKISHQILYSTWILLFIGIPSTFEILACFKSVVYHTGHNEKCDGHIKQDEVSVSQLQNSLQPNIFLSCISVSHASFQPSSSSVPFKLSQSFFLTPKYEKLHRNLNRIYGNWTDESFSWHNAIEVLFSKTHRNI